MQAIKAGLNQIVRAIVLIAGTLLIVAAFAPIVLILLIARAAWNVVDLATDFRRKLGL